MLSRIREWALILAAAFLAYSAAAAVAGWLGR